MTPILFTEEAWMGSQLSVARYYGWITYDGQKYIIVNKEGRDLFECSAIAKKEGRGKGHRTGRTGRPYPKGFPADLPQDWPRQVHCNARGASRDSGAEANEKDSGR